MITNNKNSNSDSLQNIVDPIESRFLLLGEQYFQVLIKHIIFMNITQESKYTHLIIQLVNYEELLRMLSVTFLDDDTYWDCDDYGISEKMRITFRALGKYIHTNGYDRAYNKVQNIILAYLVEKTELPIVNPQEVIDKYYQKKYSRQAHFKVSIFKEYSINDKVYSASIILNGVNYEKKGYSKKSAINNLCEYLLTMVTQYDIQEYLAEKNISIKDNSKFEINEIELQTNDNVVKLSKLYSIDPVLLHFVLLPRSQYNTSLKNMEVSLLADKKNKTFKRYLSYLGRELLRVFILEKSMNQGLWDDYDISEFDICNSFFAPVVIYSQMDDMLKTTHFASNIFDKLNLTPTDYKTDKQKN